MQPGQIKWLGVLNDRDIAINERFAIVLNQNNQKTLFQQAGNLRSPIQKDIPIEGIHHRMVARTQGVDGVHTPIRWPL